MAGAIKAPSGYGCVLPGVLVCTRTGCSAGAQHPARHAAPTAASSHRHRCPHGGVPMAVSPQPCPHSRAPTAAWLLGWVHFGEPGAPLCPASRAGLGQHQVWECSCGLFLLIILLIAALLLLVAAFPSAEWDPSLRQPTGPGPVATTPRNVPLHLQSFISCGAHNVQSYPQLANRQQPAEPIRYLRSSHL